MSAALVSVVIRTMRPTWLPLLMACLDRQTYPNVERVVVDGDGTPGYKLNRGCELAKGDIVIVCDDDDFQPPDRIARQVACLGTSAQAVACGVRMWACYDLIDDVGYLTRRQPIIGLHSMAMCREAWKPGLFDETRDKGEAVAWKLANRDRIVDICDPGLVVMFRHEGNTTGRLPTTGTRPLTDEIRKVIGTDLDLYRVAAAYPEAE